MSGNVWRWVLGLTYILAVATIWIASSFVVQSVVDAGVSPFLITFICNSLFVVYLPLFEISRYLEDAYGSILFWRSKRSHLLELAESSEKEALLGQDVVHSDASEVSGVVVREDGNGLDEKGRWTLSACLYISPRSVTTGAIAVCTLIRLSPQEAVYLSSVKDY
ncbi:hypothetical protein F2Q68_00033089 [Brassica cretica]|uniref:Uncharacterized protein n=1 Tax=Brassica cretica TaxID=69181 RepID=A0A8S9G3I7_BRACR|nr:hypothetical protein F2Q68_00033089 [Brassica cretica]